MVLNRWKLTVARPMQQARPRPVLGPASPGNGPDPRGRAFLIVIVVGQRTGVAGVEFQAQIGEANSVGLGVSARRTACSFPGRRNTLVGDPLFNPLREYLCATSGSIFQPTVQPISGIPSDNGLSEVRFSRPFHLALLRQLRVGGVEVEKVADYDYGRFAWIRDREGNLIELFQDREY